MDISPCTTALKVLFCVLLITYVISDQSDDCPGSSITNCCIGTDKICEKCADGYGATRDGQCRVCQEPGCALCTRDYTICTQRGSTAGPMGMACDESNQNFCRASKALDNATIIADGLSKIYFNKIRPLEEMYKFNYFFSSLFSKGDFQAKPSVLLLGQYSTGKTTLIKYLLGREYPGSHIGPEPTTDKFVVVMQGPDNVRTPGNALAYQTDKPYNGLTQFGNVFLSKFESATSEHPLLEGITLVDTPGVLAGKKQSDRQYDFVEVCGWFAARADMILLLFDPYKLDISDEFKNVIATLKGHDNKVRVVLNKADQLDQQHLMRVYGALMWSLAKVLKSPEVCRVYTGSFNSEAPIREDVNPAGKKLFEKEQKDLLQDLYDIPARASDMKVSEFVKRVRTAKIHFLIMDHLRRKMPFFGRKRAQAELLLNLADEFALVRQEHHLHSGDFPDIDSYRETLRTFDISKFPKLKKRMMKKVMEALNVDIPQLMRLAKYK